MPKISALPAMTSADGADPAPIVDDSAGSTKKITLTKMKEWLQSVAAWITADMVDFSTGIYGEEVGRHTLSSAADVLTVSGLSGYRYLTVVCRTIQATSTIRQIITFNGDTGSNYAVREFDAGTAVTAGSQAGITLSNLGNDAFTVTEIINDAAKEKMGLHIIGSQGTAGAGNVPASKNGTFKWANTSNAIDTVTITNNGGGDYAATSELIVYGHN